MELIIVEKFNQFKKELKKIETKTLLREYKEMWGIKENQKAYTLYWHHLMVCDYEPTNQIRDLINQYGYEIRQDSTVAGAVRNAKELNKQILLIVNFEEN
jgi:hypothetical protein